MEADHLFKPRANQDNKSEKQALYRLFKKYQEVEKKFNLNQIQSHALFRLFKTD